MTLVTLVTDDGGDWQGLYIDDRLVDENHSLSLGHVFDRLSDLGTSFSFQSFRVHEDWMLDNGRLPHNLHHIPDEVRI